MNRQHKVQMAIVLVLSLLCGTCIGLLIPCPSCHSSQSVAAFSPASLDFLKEVDDDEDLLPSPSQTTSQQMLTPAPDPDTPAPAQQNIFAIGPALTPTPAPTVSEVALSGDGFVLEVIKSDTLAPKKRVLIYHTHTYEAYEQGEGSESYQETEQWRTADSEYNVVRVGEDLVALLSGLGLDVVHDTTAFEPPNLSSAYTRSLDMLEERKSSGEQFDLYIDLHRDAYVASQGGANTVSIGGNEIAKLMLLIGKGEGQTTQGFDQKPDWESNLSIAQAITDSLNEQSAGLCKDIRLKSGRFNQHVATGCILVEVGNNRNSLQEALAAMPYLADAIFDVLN
ncbi:MAG: hypothetical protein GX096_13755 [Clostridiales bacterium]|nr:hypothetical protein [Clostridiales bacterium]